MAANSWNIPDKRGVIQRGSRTRRLVQDHAEQAASDSYGLAEALRDLVEAGYKALNGSQSQISSSMDRSPPLERRMGSEDGTDEESGTDKTRKRPKSSGSKVKKAATINPGQRRKGEIR